MMISCPRMAWQYPGYEWPSRFGAETLSFIRGFATPSVGLLLSVTPHSLAATSRPALRLVPQIRRQPAFDFGEWHALARGVGFHLVLRDPVDREIARLRVRKIEAAHCRGGVHGERLRQL